MDEAEKIKIIAEHYGYDSQSRQCIEEMAELTQAINKWWRVCGCADYVMADRIPASFYTGSKSDDYTEIEQAVGKD